MPAPGVVAAAYGGLRAIGGLISGNQRKKRNIGIINRAYQSGRERLDTFQGDTRQGFTESLGARGLAQGGGVRAGGPVVPVGQGSVSHYERAGQLDGPGAIQRAYGGMGPNIQRRVVDDPGAPKVDVTQAHDLGSQQTADLGREQQLEQDELLRQRDAALASNKSSAFNEAVGNIGQGISSGFDIMDAYGAGSTQTPTPYNAWGGIDPVDPLGRGTWGGSGDRNRVFETRPFDPIRDDPSRNELTGDFNVWSGKGNHGRR